MIGLLDKIFIKFGMWFGNLVVHLLEKIIPSLKDKNQNLHGFTGHLERFNLTNKENFKRYFKTGIALSLSIAFWVYFTILLIVLNGIFDIKTHIILLKATLIIFILLLLICTFIAYKLSYGR